MTNPRQDNARDPRRTPRLIATTIFVAMAFGFGAVPVLGTKQGDASGLVDVPGWLAAGFLAVPVALALRELHLLIDAGKTPPNSENGTRLAKALGTLALVAPLVWVFAPSFRTNSVCSALLYGAVFVATTAVITRGIDPIADWLVRRTDTASQ